jgi:hypothetical protein
MIKYFYDTEFVDNGETIDLISIGIVCEDGREYYAVNRNMPQYDIKRDDWLHKHVWPSLPTVTQQENWQQYLAHAQQEQAETRENPDATPLQLMESDLRVLRLMERERTAFTDDESRELDTKHPDVKTRALIAEEVREFLLAKGPIELWAHYAAYDHVVLAQLFGRMIDLPTGVPMHTMDIIQVAKLAGVGLPYQAAGRHNALEDARHNKVMYDALVENGALKPRFLS